MMASTTTQPTVTTKPALPGSNLFWIGPEFSAIRAYRSHVEAPRRYLGRKPKIGERLAWGVLVLAAGTVLFISLSKLSPFVAGATEASRFDLALYRSPSKR